MVIVMNAAENVAV